MNQSLRKVFVVVIVVGLGAGLAFLTTKPNNNRGVVSDEPKEVAETVDQDIATTTNTPVDTMGIPLTVEEKITESKVQDSPTPTPTPAPVKETVAKTPTPTKQIKILPTDDIETTYKKALTAPDATSIEKQQMSSAITKMLDVIKNGTRDEIKEAIGANLANAEARAEFDAMSDEDLGIVLELLADIMGGSLDALKDTENFYVKVTDKTAAGTYTVMFLEKDTSNGYSTMSTSFKDVGGTWELYSEM
jgi:hypothetical protein